MGDDGAADYGDVHADVYDRWYGHLDHAGQTEGAVEFLRRIAGEGPVLELGVGTGRVAIPLAATGLEVHGIDASAAMLDRLRAKPGGDGVVTHQGDMAGAEPGGPFTLVFAVFSTLFALTTQEEQTRCLRNVAARLPTGGRCVLEAAVPDPSGFVSDQRVSIVDLGADQVRLELAVHDAVNQHVGVQHLTIAGGSTDLRPFVVRYVWPSELDLMAKLAGLALVARWGGWRGEPFTPRSVQHVSVFQKV